jgi:hypothetical protein
LRSFWVRGLALASGEHAAPETPQFGFGAVEDK